MYNAANPKQVRQADKQAKFNRNIELDDVRFVLSSKFGRRFVWRYLQRCGVFKSSFTGNSHTFFLEGERNIGLQLLADIEDAEPEKLVLMMKENKEQENARGSNFDGARNTQADGAADTDEDSSN